MVTLTPTPNGMRIEEDAPPKIQKAVDVLRPKSKRHSQGKRTQALKRNRRAKAKVAKMTRKRNR